MTRLYFASRKSEQGVVLLIALAFMVLLTGLIIVYFSRATSSRDIANANSAVTAADILARGALEITVADLQQEIANGGTATAVNIEPQHYPAPAPIPNLVRRSVRSDPVVAPGISSRASAVNSLTDAALNGRSINLTRWNSHYLVPKASAGDDTSAPITTGFTSPNYWAPDWVIVTRTGPIPFNGWSSGLNDATAGNNSYAVGRYAYAIYNEGGLLDINVAGYPTDATQAGTAVATNAPVGGKGWLALTDLVPIVSAKTIPLQRAAINGIIGWRNYATAQPSGTFPNFTFTTGSGTTWFTNFVTNNASAFLLAGSQKWKGPSGSGPDCTDQYFVTRQELISIRSSAQFAATSLQYLGTFSRELNYPTWAAANSLTVATQFTRRDGSTAKVGDPLIRRFPVSELAWIGPTGPVSPGTAQSVQRDFGLVWNTGGFWEYRGSSGSTLASTIPNIDGTKELEFFQLLHLAKPTATMQQILTIGACVVDQYDGDNTTTRIDYAGPPMPPSTTNAIAWGMENTTPPQPTGAPSPRGALILNRPFYDVGEFGYANSDVTLPTPAPTPRTLDFYTASSPDGGILDLFGMSTAAERAGVVDLNTANSAVLAGILSFATATQPATALSSTRRNSTSTGLTAATAAGRALSRQDIPRLAAQSAITGGEEIQEVVARSLADTSQTRTWNLLIDVIAQSGRYPPNATSLANFVVRGEKRYWLHVAIDRFTNRIVDQQLEAVYQ